jgi:hypothetical protein
LEDIVLSVIQRFLILLIFLILIDVGTRWSGNLSF